MKQNRSGKSAGKRGFLLVASVRAAVLFASAWWPLAHAALPPDLAAKAKAALPANPLAVVGFHAKPGCGTGQLVPGEGKAPALFQVDVTKRPSQKWEVGTQWKCAIPVKAGDTLLLSFEARSLRPGGGGAIQAVFRRRQKPYEHSLNEAIRTVGRWREFSLAFSPTFTEKAGETLLILNFGARRQRTEIRKLSLVDFGSAVSIGQLRHRLGVTVAGGGGSVGTPLTPRVLWEVGAVRGLDPAGYTTTANGGWSATYAIWTCHGYRFKANRVVGMLRLERGPTQNGTFRLLVHQDIVNDEAVVYRVDVNAVCRADRLDSPVSWSLHTQCLDPDGKPEKGTDQKVTARVEGTRWIVHEAGHVFERYVGEPLTTDWGLFAALGRMPRHKGICADFDELEGFSAFKTDQQLRYRGLETVPMGDQSVRLHHFTMIGHGVLPYDFWLDEQQRLQFVITHARVYILSSHAESEYRQTLAIQKKRFDRLRPQLAAEKEQN